MLGDSINRIVEEQLRQGLVLDFADSKKKKKKTKVSKKDKKGQASEEHLIGLGVEMGFEPDTVNTKLGLHPVTIIKGADSFSLGEGMP